MRSQTARAGSAKRLEVEKLAKTPAGKRQQSKTMPSHVGLVTRLHDDQRESESSQRRQQEEEQEEENEMNAAEVLRRVPRSIRKQVRSGRPATLVLIRISKPNWIDCWYVQIWIELISI